MDVAATRLTLGAILILLCGCLQFKEQTMSYRHDPDTDRLLLFQDYRGIYGNDAKGVEGVPLSDKEETQLESVLSGQRTFFFSNWIDEYTRADVEKALAGLRDRSPEDERLSGEEVRKLTELAELALDKIHIENLGFYVGEGGKVCAAQRVTISALSKLVQSLNECGIVFMREFAAEDERTPEDRAATANFIEGAALDFVTVDGNCLTLHWPLSKASYEKAFCEDSADSSRIAEMRKAGIGISWKDDVVTFVIGDVDDRVTRLTLTGNEGHYVTNLLERVRADKLPLTSLDPEAAAAKFLLGE